MRHRVWLVHTHPIPFLAVNLCACVCVRVYVCVHVHVCVCVCVYACVYWVWQVHKHHIAFLALNRCVVVMNTRTHTYIPALTPRMPITRLCIWLICLEYTFLCIIGPLCSLQGSLYSSYVYNTTFGVCYRARMPITSLCIWLICLQHNFLCLS